MEKKKYTTKARIIVDEDEEEDAESEMKTKKERQNRRSTEEGDKRKG